jgi:hypothetical protein
MDWLTFISSVVKSLAWPAVVAYLLYLLRPQLLSLADKIQEITLPWGISAKFSRELQRASEDSERIQLPPPKISEQPDSAAFRGVVGEDPQFLELAAKHPDLAVLDAYKQVERKLIEGRSEFKVQGLDPSFVSFVRNLNEREIIDGDARQLFDHLRRLRNAAVHAGAPNIITSGEAVAYKDLCDLFISALDFGFERARKRELDSKD